LISLTGIIIELLLDTAESDIKIKNDAIDIRLRLSISSPVTDDFTALLFERRLSC